MPPMPLREADRQYLRETLGVLWYAVRPDQAVPDHPAVRPAPDRVNTTCRHLADQLGIDTVEVFVWSHPFVNVIPLGTRRHGVLVLSTTFLEFLDGETLEAAVAHELAHIKFGHARRIAAAILALGFAVLLVPRQGSQNRRLGLVAHIVGMIVGGLLLLALIRRYERQADRGALSILGDPRPLARAIVAVQTGDPHIDLSEYAPVSRSAVHKLVDVYPRAEDRFPAVIRRPR